MEDPYLPEDISSPVFVAGMLCSLFGLIVLFFRFRKLITSGSYLYGCIIAVGLTSFFWVTQISPYLSQGLNPQYWTEIIIYPVGLMAIAVPLSLFLMTSLGSTWSYRFLFITMLVTSLSIIQYSGAVVRSDPSSPITLNDSLILSDFFNSVAYLFLGTAYLHPSFQQFRSSLPNKSSVISRLDLFILGSAFCLAPTAYFRMRSEGFELDVTPVLIGMLVIFVLVQTRLAQLVRLLESQNQQVNRQKELLHHQANHDTLTHLPNRLFLVNYLKEIT